MFEQWQESRCISQDKVQKHVWGVQLSKLMFHLIFWPPISKMYSCAVMLTTAGKCWGHSLELSLSSAHCDPSENLSLNLASYSARTHSWKYDCTFQLQQLSSECRRALMTGITWDSLKGLNPGSLSQYNNSKENRILDVDLEPCLHPTGHHSLENYKGLSSGHWSRLLSFFCVPSTVHHSSRPSLFLSRGLSCPNPQSLALGQISSY